MCSVLSHMLWARLWHWPGGGLAADCRKRNSPGPRGRSRGGVLPRLSFDGRTFRPVHGRFRERRLRAGPAYEDRREVSAIRRLLQRCPRTASCPERGSRRSRWSSGIARSTSERLGANIADRRAYPGAPLHWELSRSSVILLPRTLPRPRPTDAGGSPPCDAFVSFPLALRVRSTKRLPRVAPFKEFPDDEWSGRDARGPRTGRALDGRPAEVAG